MLKKILIPVVVFVGFITMAFYKVKHLEEKTVISNAAIYPPIVVLELFTSQGCSSCPPADVLLEKAKNQYPDQLFALSYHVDYWNYIGWEDPFSNPNFSKKQREYNRKFRYPSNYTPEMVINGKEHFVGSNSGKLRSKIDAYLDLKIENHLVLENVAKNGNTIAFNYALAGPLQGKQLRAILVLDERTTVVKRGENRNRALKNSNIVIAEQYLTDTSASGNSVVQLPSGIGKNEKLHLIVLAENENLEITGAAKYSL
ncbi:MAG: DUF1223 domain-containing protein [Bacteroidota bacterium]